MTHKFRDYQDDADSFNANPVGYQWASLGLAGEAGEVCDLLKKHLYHGHELNKEKLKEELGDVLWSISQIAREAGFTLGEVAEANIIKLKARYPNGFSHEASRNRPEYVAGHSPAIGLHGPIPSEPWEQDYE